MRSPCLQEAMDPGAHGVAFQESPQLTILGTCLECLARYSHHPLALGSSLGNLGHALTMHVA